MIFSRDASSIIQEALNGDDFAGKELQGNNISRENLHREYDKKRKKKPPSGTEKLSSGRDPAAFKRETDYSKTDRESLPDRRDRRIYAGLYTRRPGKNQRSIL